MKVEIRFPAAADSLDRTFVTWRPIEARLKLVEVPAASPNVPVTLSSTATAGGGRVNFAAFAGAPRTPTLNVMLPANGAEVTVWVGGVHPNASARFGDVAVEARPAAGGAVLGRKELMVRIRKNANLLTPTERDRFLRALATLNGSGAGRFAALRDMHKTAQSLAAAHGAPGFLPWHRVYMLDLERELQAIDGEVALPYWRFDQAAPNLFSRAFIGLPDGAGRVQFVAGHPLLNWVTDGVAGIQRGNVVGPNTVLPLRTEAQTLALGGGPPPTYANFDALESNPHNGAHSRHLSGFIIDPGTAPKDPLFFLLHCNVDRLWAKWQFLFGLHDPANARSFDPASTLAGHRLNDSMWPWNTAGAPGGTLAMSPMTPAPGPSPRIRDMINYLGKGGAQHLGFAYDDVPL
jgi:tyrosinase